MRRAGRRAARSGPALLCGLVLLAGCHARELPDTTPSPPEGALVEPPVEPPIEPPIEPPVEPPVEPGADLPADPPAPAPNIEPPSEASSAEVVEEPEDELETSQARPATPPPASPPTAAPPPSPPPEPEQPPRLRPAEAGPDRLAIQRKLTEAEELMRRVKDRPLNDERREQAEAVRSFIAQAAEALEAGELQRASVLAEKGLLLAKDVESASRR